MNAASAIAAFAESRFVRNLIIGTARGGSVVWEYPISTLSMSVLVRPDAFQNAWCCTCEEMLRQQ
jgi:hypothetical protein